MKCCMLAIISTPLDIYYFKILINNIMKLVSIFASVKGGLQKCKAVDGWNCCLQTASKTPNERSGHLKVLLSNARRFYPSRGNPLAGKGLSMRTPILLCHVFNPVQLGRSAPSDSNGPIAGERSRGTNRRANNALGHVKQGTFKFGGFG